MKLRNNIHDYEVECNCGCGFNAVSPAILDIVQWVRDTTGKAVHINGKKNHCACRCEKHNKKVGGSSTSKHLPDPITEVCRAIDFEVEGIPHQDIYDLLDNQFPNSLGIGLYSWGIHVDDRMDKAYRW